MKDLRKHFNKVIVNNNNQLRNEEFSKDILCCHISDISISGKVGWSFCSSDDEKDDSVENKKLDLDFFGEKRKNIMHKNGITKKGEIYP